MKTATIFTTPQRWDFATPPLPPDKIVAQLAAYAAKGKRSIRTRYVWIVGCSPATPDMLDHAHAAAFGAHRLLATGWHVLVCDHDQLAPRVVTTCRTYKIPYTVYGENKNPRTRVNAKHYQRVMGSERMLLDTADLIVAFGRPDIINKAQRRRIPAFWNGVAIPIQLPLWASAETQPHRRAGFQG